MGGDKNCHGIELAHWQKSCIAGLSGKYTVSKNISFVGEDVGPACLNWLKKRSTINEPN